MKQDVLPFVSELRGFVFHLNERKKKKGGGRPHQITVTSLLTSAIDTGQLKHSLPHSSPPPAITVRKSRQNSSAKIVCHEKSIQFKPHS